MKWSDLSKNQRIGVGVAAATLLAIVIAGAYAIGRAGGTDADVAEESTATAEVAGTAEPSTTAQTEPEASEPEVTESETEAETEETVVPDSGPSDETEVRLFGQLKGIRDESGGSWASLWVDVDTAAFLTGQEALDYLSSNGMEAYYNANYWYPRNEDHAVGSYRILSSDQPAVWMYTWPDVPDPGFYGPGMDKQVTEFGIFYDQIYMNADADAFLNRYYWFTIEDGHVTVIEEQPSDPYFEP